MPASRTLVAWSGALLVLLAGHDLTHLFDDGLRTDAGALAAVAVPQWIASAVVFAVLVRAGRRRAATVALLLGGATVVGVVAVHLLPFSSAAYADLDPSVVSWLFALVPVAVGAVVVGLALRERRLPSSSHVLPSPRPS